MTTAGEQVSGDRSEGWLFRRFSSIVTVIARPDRER
jgi:hypothetical protein